MEIKQITYKRQHNKDIRQKRATYGISYPNEHVFFDTYHELKEISIEEHEESIKPKILDKKISFNFITKNIENYYFHRCSFHSKRGLDLNKIELLTFRDCTFKESYLGTIIFERVIFQDCSFERCDFSFSVFNDCIFEKCLFLNCSAENINFNRTEIDPKSFLDGITYPDYNLDNCTEAFKKELLRKWKSIRYRIATSIHNSNSGLSITRYSDISLFHLKKEEYLYFTDLFRHLGNTNGIKKENFLLCFFKHFDLASRLIFIKLNLILSKGGISISRLFWVAVVLILFFNFIIGFLPINYNDIEMNYSAVQNNLSCYFENFPRTISLFFSFGFTSFKASSSFSSFYLIFVPIIGLIWFAFLIPNLLRRIYK